jgi:hypothetical protein
MARLWFVLLSLASGCFQPVSPIRTVEAAQGLTFELWADTRSIKGHRELLELMVTKRDCASDCTMWSIERASRQGGDAPLAQARILYGKPLAGTVVRTPARKLEPARYAVSATVQEYGARGELARSSSLAGEFTIDSHGKAGNER